MQPGMVMEAAERNLLSILIHERPSLDAARDMFQGVIQCLQHLHQGRQILVSVPFFPLYLALSFTHLLSAQDPLRSQAAPSASHARSHVAYHRLFVDRRSRDASGKFNVHRLRPSGDVRDQGGNRKRGTLEGHLDVRPLGYGVHHVSGIHSSLLVRGG